MITEEEETARFVSCPVATDFSEIEAFGYTVTVTENPAMPYRISGPRNVRYALMRNVKNPTMLFAVYDRPGKFGVAKVHGYAWFAERNGALKACK
jgi:hypothetical protein